MRIRFEYPVKTALRFKELWPVTVSGVKLEWRMRGDEPIGLIVSSVMADADRLPTLTVGTKDGIAAHIDAGHISRHDEMDSTARTVQGLVSLFASIDVNFDECKISWEPETEEERGLLKVNGFARKTETMNMWAPRPMAYDLVARAMASADHALDQEVTLAFLRRGRQEFHAGHFIQAFYNFFFFLETQYAAGYSNPKHVTKALLEAKPLRDTLARLRAGKGDEKLSSECAKLFALDDEALINHLVKTRGRLHHHAKCRPDIWHPDKSDAVLAEADALQLIVHDIALRDALATMYAEDKNTKLFESARADGATTKVKVIGTGIRRDGRQIALRPIVVTMPGRIIDRDKLHHVHEQIRARNRFNTDEVELIEYSIRSEDERQTFAVWRRMDLTPKANGDTTQTD